MAASAGRQASRSVARLGRLRLNPLRPLDSVRLDTEPLTERGFQGQTFQAPPYLSYPEWDEQFVWRQGEHMTAAGQTGSGKTTFMRRLLRRRRYVVVMATKSADSSLYPPLEAEGFKVVTRWDPDPVESPRIIFKPPLRGGVEGKDAQREAFRAALLDVFETGSEEGGWCVYCDEVRYLTEFLNLKTEMELLWLQGRSLGISVVAATQRPVSIPILAFEAQHLFVWRFSHKPDIDTISHFTGTLSPVVRQTVPRLPKHEVLHVQPEYGSAERTKLPEDLT
jgi:DNA helicase HerA-like ATPase